MFLVLYGYNGGKKERNLIFYCHCPNQHSFCCLFRLNWSFYPNTKHKHPLCVCPQGEERERLRVELEESRDKARRRSLGNIKFIGELFKLKMLTEAIMHDCVVKLLKNHDEESLECLCRLLSTIGKDLDFEKAKVSKALTHTDGSQWLFIKHLHIHPSPVMTFFFCATCLGHWLLVMGLRIWGDSSPLSALKSLFTLRSTFCSLDS